jgi:DNA-binding response OmpR family regulator
MIDDDEELSSMLAEYLGRSGFEVTSRPSAAQGLAASAGKRAVSRRSQF